MMLIEPAREERTFLRFVPSVWVRGDAWFAGVFGAFFYLFAFALILHSERLAGRSGLMASVVASMMFLYAGAVLPRLSLAAERRTAWLDMLGRYRRNRLAVVGLVLLVAFVSVAVLAPVLATYDPVLQNPAHGSYRAPSLTHIMGTDKFGRDLFSRTVFGARVSLAVGLVAVMISSLIGLLLGSFSGYAGGRMDDAIMRIVDGLLAFPRLLLVLTLVAFFAQSTGVVVLMLGATGWMASARLVRADVIRLKESEFVQAAVVSGASRRRVVLRHLVPNALGPLLITATLRVGTIILLEAYLSFLGLGVQPPTPSWGSMVFEGRDVLLSAWWVSAFPGLAIVLAVVACNLVGDGLRDAADVRG